ncbi:hypothetical protein [Streptomyces sp. NBC_01422]|uniref:hypothetical protein n=1 Tax=Streptomyces sp. NBC_01422 TaxID=2903859 RepID=UPI002E29A9CA|nr:hypothetical protein [Streptomyces sp. NBC_01422]
MPTRRNFTAGLTAASARLREVNSPDLAAHVDEALAVIEGEIFTARKDEKLPIRLPITARDRIVAGAAEASRTVTADVNEAFTRFLAGEFTLNQPVRARRGAAEDKVNLNVRANKTLMDQVAATGALPMHVAADWLMRKYETGPYAPGAQHVQRPAGSTRAPQVPRPVRDLIRARVAEAGKNVNAEIEEGFTRFLAGEFTPVAPAWPADADMVPFKVNPNNDLFDEVKARAEGVTPMQVAMAFLLETYGIDPDTAAE